MEFYGAQTEQLREQAGLTEGAAVRIGDLITGLGAVVAAVPWVGPDAEDFRERWSDVAAQCESSVALLRDRCRELDGHAEEQDEASGGNVDGGGSPWDRFIDSLLGEGHMESDGLWGDLLGGAESGALGNIGWNSLGSGVDVASMIPAFGLPATIVGLAMDVPSIGIGLYDMAQSFQDGELFGTVDGAVTAGLNTVDAAAGVLSIIPVTAPIGELAGVFTSGLDALWSGVTVTAQMDAISGGGDHEGSTTRFLLEAVGVDSGMLDSADSLFGTATENIRDRAPFIDPMIDGSQLLVESVIPQGAQEWIEDGAAGINDWVDQNVPWFR